MQRKPVVLILTSSDERGGAAENYAAAIRADGRFNTVVLGEDKYGAKDIFGKHSKAAFRADKRRLLTCGAASAGRLLRAGTRRGRLHGRNRRVANAVKRYAPEYVLTVTPYAQAAFTEAKRRAGFDVPSVHAVTSFVLPGTDYPAYAADVYLVENADVKEELVSRGIPSRHVAVTGLPFDAPRVTPAETEDGKQELGLPRTPTVFVNAGGRDAVEILGLLADQGDIINIACYAEDVKLLAALRTRADRAETRSNVVLITRKDMFREYLLMSDIVITRFEPSVVYTCFKAGKPVVAFGKNAEEEKNVAYLAERKLVMPARSDIDVVALIYKFMQTDTASEYVENGVERTEMFSLENTANYLAAYSER